MDLVSDLTPMVSWRREPSRYEDETNITPSSFGSDLVEAQETFQGVLATETKKDSCSLKFMETTAKGLMQKRHVNRKLL